MDELYGTGPAAERFPIGTYETTSGGAVITMAFDSYGRYTVARDEEFAVRGSYRVSGDEIELTDLRGPRAGMGDRQTGTYKWHIEAETLTFTLIQDVSPGRKRACAQPWFRQG